MPLTTESAYRKDMTTGYADMQHRHFTTIAAIIRDISNMEERENMAVHFADRLWRTNPNFNRDRFFRACMSE